MAASIDTLRAGTLRRGWGRFNGPLGGAFGAPFGYQEDAKRRREWSETMHAVAELTSIIKQFPPIIAYAKACPRVWRHAARDATIRWPRRVPMSSLSLTHRSVCLMSCLRYCSSLTRNARHVADRL